MEEKEIINSEKYEKPKNNNKALIIIGIIFCILLLAVGVLLYLNLTKNNSKESEVVEKDTIDDNEIEENKENDNIVEEETAIDNSNIEEDNITVDADSLAEYLLDTEYLTIEILHNKFVDDFGYVREMKSFIRDDANEFVKSLDQCKVTKHYSNACEMGGGSDYTISIIYEKNKKSYTLNLIFTSFLRIDQSNDTGLKKLMSTLYPTETMAGCTEGADILILDKTCVESLADKYMD